MWFVVFVTILRVSVVRCFCSHTEGQCGLLFLFPSRGSVWLVVFVPILRVSVVRCFCSHPEGQCGSLFLFPY